MGKMHDALKKAGHDRRSQKAAVSTAAERVAKDATPRRPNPATESAAPAQLRNAFQGGDIDPHLVALLDPHSPHAEQYRTLRTNVLASRPDDPVKSVVVTSAVPGEGKSVSSSNFALSMAEDTDRKVVLIDADMRKPTIHKLFGIDNTHGLSDYLSGGVMLEMVLQRCRLPNLWIMPAGRIPPNPAELLGGKRMEDLIDRLRRDYDFTVIDTPPVVSTTDPGVVSPRVDGTLLVVRMESTPREVAKHAVELLKKARAKLLGLVLTGLSGDVKDYYYYPYNKSE